MSDNSCTCVISYRKNNYGKLCCRLKSWKNTGKKSKFYSLAEKSIKELTPICKMLKVEKNE